MKKRKSSLKNAVSSPVKANEPTILKTNEPVSPGEGYEMINKVEGKDGKWTYTWQKVTPGTTTETPGGTHGGLGCRAQWEKNKEELIAEGYKTWAEFKPYCEGYVEERKKPPTSTTTDPTTETVTQEFIPESDSQTRCSKEEIAAMKAECEAREPTKENGRWIFQQTTEYERVQRSSGRWETDYGGQLVADRSGECGRCHETEYHKTPWNPFIPKKDSPKPKTKKWWHRKRKKENLGCSIDPNGNMVCPSGTGEMGGGVALS